MDLTIIAKVAVAAMFSPPGIANFIISTILKKRWQASLAAILAASAFMFINGKALAQQSTADYTIGVIGSVIGMMIASHLAFTIGEKIIRRNKTDK
jgi:uncharacterized membrane protein